MKMTTILNNYEYTYIDASLNLNKDFDLWWCFHLAMAPEMDLGRPLGLAALNFRTNHVQCYSSRWRSETQEVAGLSN